MVIVLLLIIIFLLAPWIFGLLSLAAISIFSILAYLFPIVILIILFVSAINSIRKMPEERKKAAKKRLAMASAAVMAVALIVVCAIWLFHNHTFSMGKKALHQSISTAQHYFDELPDRYHAKVAGYLIEEAERSKTTHGYDSALSCLSLAEEYLPERDEKLKEIQTLRLECLIYGNHGEEASKLILSEYWDSRYIVEPEVSGKKAVDYALQMYDFSLEGAYPMRDDAIDLLWDLANTYPPVDLAKEKHAKLSGWPEAYRQAIDWLNAHQNYNKAAKWFSAHRDYECSEEYLSLATGVLQLCGTWKDSQGNVLVIEVDPTKPIKMWSSGFSESPVCIYLNMTLNGEDISYSYDMLLYEINGKRTLKQACINTEEPYNNGTVRYDFSYDGSTGNYQIWTYDYDEGIIHLTYKTEYNKQKWSKAFQKVN